MGRSREDGQTAGECTDPECGEAGRARPGQGARQVTMQ